MHIAEGFSRRLNVRFGMPQLHRSSFMADTGSLKRSRSTLKTSFC